MFDQIREHSHSFGVRRNLGFRSLGSLFSSTLLLQQNIRLIGEIDEPSVLAFTVQAGDASKVGEKGSRSEPQEPADL